jgi:two-component system sensor histidine kinase PhcS
VSNKFFNDKEALRAFAGYERQIYLRHLEVGSYLVMTLMPAGVVLDYFVYREKTAYFFGLRMLSALLGGLIWLVLQTPVRNKIDRHLSLALALIPSFFICWMIYATDGASSTYYAGLNLVLLSVALVMRWSADLSVTASVLVILMYFGTCLLHDSNSDKMQPGVLVNNLYFLSLTGIIVAVSGWIHHSLRVREFILNYQLDQNKRELESTNLKLADQNTALEKANRDIMAAEAQLVQSEKMASLGLLAAKIAHEIRNPLHYARMNLDTLRKRCKNLPPEQHAEAGAIFADMDDGISRIDTIVSDLLTFAQPSGQEPEPVDVAHVFKTTLRYVASQLQEKNVRLVQDLAPGHIIQVNRQQFNQVLVNLIENSIDAFAAKKFSGDEAPLIKISCRTENGRCRLAIRDNGMGIEPQNLAKIFDPFFTTKDIGKGTGLGLSICFGIIRGFGGTLTAESEPGKFCEFTIDLPAGESASKNHGNR